MPIDWLTLTMSNKDDQYMQAVQLSLDCLKSEAELGNMVQPHYGRGGFKGSKAGQIGVLQNDWGLQVQLSGGLADILARQYAYLPMRCTRIDIQATIDCAPYGGSRGVIEVDYRDAVAKNTRLQRKRKMKWVVDPFGGATFYVGSRESDTYCRVYEKGKQLGDTSLWEYLRYEVEFKGERAYTVWQQVAEMTRIKPESVDSAGIALIQRVFAERGVNVDYFLPDGSHTLVIDDTVSRQDTDVYRKLRWLAVSVAPTIRFLTQRGHEIDVIGALGLSTIDEANWDSGTVDGYAIGLV